MQTTHKAPVLYCLPRIHRAISIVLLSCCLSMLPSISLAVIESTDFADPASQQRYRSLIEEFRCLVCQNQNIADSDAGLAKDLRRKTREMIIAGDSDQEIREYMRERYGDFVLYNPPFEARNALLWLMPFAFLLIAITAVFWTIRRKNQLRAVNQSDSSQTADPVSMAKARTLIDSDDTPNSI